MRPTVTYPQYQNNPAGYIKDILHLNLTPGQLSAVEALMSPPRRVLVSSGHSVGKSTLGAALVNWFFDSRRGITLTTAPTDRQVKDILWKEVRLQRERAGLEDFWVGPKIPRLEASPDHFAHGYTARDATRFQGQHSPGGLLVIFDEAEGVESGFWEALKTMLDDTSFFVGFYNPTTPGSACHQAEQQADDHAIYRRVTLSCLDHPNIHAQLAGEDTPIPGAIALSQLRSMLLEDSMVLSPGDPEEPGDVTLGTERFRPGPIAEARCLGRRPKQAISGLWSDDLWERLLKVRLTPQPQWPFAIGCDVARYGDDHTVIMVRHGLCLMHCETHIKLNTRQVADRLRELCEIHKNPHNPSRRIPVLIDEGGVGGGVIDQADGYLFCPINASCRPRNPARYFNTRTELWFTAREPALSGQLDLSRLPPAYLQRLKAELMAAKYRILPGTDRLQVSSKDDMKALLKRSPDMADAFCLTFYPPPVIIP